MSDEPRGSEQRRYRRTIQHFNVLCRVLGVGGSEYVVEVRDLSAGGTRLHSYHEIPEEARVAIEFKRPEIELDSTMHGNVIWSRRNPLTDEYDLGVRFSETESFAAEKLFDKVTALAPEEEGEDQQEQEQESSPAPPEERRLAPRVQEDCPVHYRNYPAGWFASWHLSRAADISGSGLAFFASEPIEEKTMIEIEISLPGTSLKPRPRALVIRCLPEDEDTYRVGAHFIDMSEQHHQVLAEYIARSLQERLETQ